MSQSSLVDLGVMTRLQPGAPKKFALVPDSRYRIVSLKHLHWLWAYAASYSVDNGVSVPSDKQPGYEVYCLSPSVVSELRMSAAMHAVFHMPFLSRD